jgi:putative NIF3 family GTP cyclohydrolase 1 type 2
VSPTVGDVERAIEKRFPLVRAEGWDRNGLLAGDRSVEVTGVRLALDPTLEVVDLAANSGQNLVVTHHPAALAMPDAIVRGGGVAGVLFAALDAGVALVNAHTNLDRDPVAQRRLPELLGFEPIGPLETGLAEMSLVAVYLPSVDAAEVIAAMASAGAGRIGDYTDCSFSVRGEGRFTVPSTGIPAVGHPGAAEVASEDRVEMVCATAAVRSVVEACLRAHPYEEPLVTVTECRMARNAARFGMVSRSVPGITLATLAERCRDVFGTTPRVWGDPERRIGVVATATGSAGSLVDDARAAEADVLVAGEVRYHDAMTAAGEMAVIELGHDVSEWPLVEVLAGAVRQTPDLDSSIVTVETPTYGWWTPTYRANKERPNG